MTGTVIQSRRRLLAEESHPGAGIAGARHFLGLLLLLLVARLVVRVRGIPNAATITRTVDVALAPLFVAFILILYIRLLEIIPLG